MLGVAPPPAPPLYIAIHNLLDRVHTDVHAPNMYLVLAPRKNTASRHTTVDHTTTPSLAALAMGIVSKLTDKLVGGRPLMKRSRLPERSETRLRLES